MEPMTIREIMDAVGGKLLGEFGDINRMVGRVETDSRTIHAGSLFVPLVGERFDGHAYINAALEGALRAALPSGSGRAICRASSISRWTPPSGPCGIWPSITRKSSPYPWWP